MGQNLNNLWGGMGATLEGPSGRCWLASLLGGVFAGLARLQVNQVGEFAGLAKIPPSERMSIKISLSL